MDIQKTHMNKNISFLGVTFKPNTDDMRDSSSLKMIPYLCKRGAKVRYYDPSGEKNEFKKIGMDPDLEKEEAIKRASVIIDCTPKGPERENKLGYFINVFRYFLTCSDGSPSFSVSKNNHSGCYVSLTVWEIC